jgi:hypothetical protein
VQILTQWDARIERIVQVQAFPVRKYLLYQYKSTCFTGTQVQILTQQKQESRKSALISVAYATDILI